MESVSPALMALIEGVPLMHEALEMEFADATRLADMQLGYAVDVTGRDLSGTNEGDWKAAWLVFGYDYGDPVFVNRREEARGFPVYTAEHGTGSWVPQEIAVSFAAFTQILSVLNASMHAGEINYRQLEAGMTACTDNMDFWDVVIEGIEDNLA